MKYYEIEFNVSCRAEMKQDACDLLTALSAEAGLESFEESENGVTGYVQQALFDKDALDALLNDFPFSDVLVTYEVREAEHRDWNEMWEQAGFNPIIVEQRCIIHDGRHLDGISVGDFPLSIEIDAHLAFGTGTHETTRLMIASLLSKDLKGWRVLDCGCGTGILGIAALKGGARESVGYDIDEWSVENARHNAIINRVEDHYVSLLGDASVLDSVEGEFDLVLANINRNILLSDMPAFCEKLTPGGFLSLSGFYKTDKALLVDAADGLGLQLVEERTEGEWMCLVFQRFSSKSE